jgi:uncharacterized Zn finger protein (UPF0148 family)
MVAQLAGPLVFGLPMLLRKDRPRFRASKRAEVRTETATADESKLVPLACPGCGAPVALAGDSFPCPHCRTTVRPPDEYVRTLRLRDEVRRELHAAERRWRWSRWTSSWLATWAIRLAFIGWLGVVLFAAMELDEWPGLVKFLAIILAIVEVLIGLGLASAYGAAKKTLPAVPSAQFRAAPSGAETCTGCGAPIAFVSGALATLCNYCGADNYREALAESARTEAQSQRTEAKKSLLEAMRELDSRRKDVLAMVGFMAMAEVFYGVVFGFYGVYHWVFG